MTCDPASLDMLYCAPWENDGRNVLVAILAACAALLPVEFKNTCTKGKNESKTESTSPRQKSIEVIATKARPALCSRQTAETRVL